MGRSQVKYNQRNGRPGQKGRGGRGNAGRGDDELQQRPIKQQQQQQQVHGDLGDNTWRYSRHADATNESQLDQQLLALESHGNYANQVSAMDEYEDNMTIPSTAALNVEHMEKALLTVSLRQILRLPAYLTASLEEQSRRAPRKKQTAADEAKEETRSKEQPLQEQKAAANDEIVKEESEEEDDMESWLDSVIL